jgi:hypothetical protein
MTNDERDCMIRETHETVCRLDERFASDHALLGKVATTVYGNGRVGLCSKVHLLMWILGVTTAIAVSTAGTLLAKAWAGN